MVKSGNLIKSLSEMANLNEFVLKAVTNKLDKVSREIEASKKEQAKLSKPDVVEIPTFEVFKTQLLRTKLTLTQSNLAENRNLVCCFVSSITLEPIEREVIAEFNKSPFSVFMENLKNTKKQMEGAFAPSIKLVAGANRICIWNPKNQAIRVSSARVISWIEQKNEFSRGAMEIALGLNLGQAEWWVKELLKKGVIKRTNKKAPKKVGISKQQVIYRYIK